MKSSQIPSFEESLSGKAFAKCGVPMLQVTEGKDLIEEFAGMAEKAGADVEILSIETEEGQMLKESFGGIAAILRFRP
ncbi:MAG: hypothetical protein HWN71_10270 [Desulfobacterales bacterium]|nr:hypothetical protein [Desulfobacterales bacterium]